MSKQFVFTGKEMSEFRKALHSAFNRGELIGVVFDLGGPEYWEDIVSPGATGQQLVELVSWANRYERAWELLRVARDHNPTNSTLKAFDEAIQARLNAGDAPPSRSPLTPDQRTRLVETLVKIPATDTPDGRSGLLRGLPNPASLHRALDSQEEDIRLMVDQLASQGRLRTGELPLLLFIHNAKSLVIGYERETDLDEILDAIRESLIQIYERL